MKFGTTITAIDAHAGGEPGRVIIGGVIDVPGDSMLAKRDHLAREGDQLRKLMLREPRGYPATCCNLVLPPTIPQADAGFVIMEQAEYPGMSGSNTICTATVLIAERLVSVTEPVTDLVLEAPAGLIRVRAVVRNGVARSITFENVPAFAVHLDAPVEVPDIGTVNVDVAWGGMFFAIVEAAALGLALTPDEGRDIVRIGEMVKAAAREQIPVAHPLMPGLGGISIAELTAPPTVPGVDGRNTVVVSSGTLDWARPARPHGRGTRPRPAGHRAGLRARGHPGHDLDRAPAARGVGWTVSGGGPAADRPSLDHRSHRVRGRSRRSVPRGFHAGRPVGDRALLSPCRTDCRFSDR